MLQPQPMPQPRKTVLVIGNPLAVDFVESLALDYTVISYSYAQKGSSPVANWSAAAMRELIMREGAKYDAVVVDLGKSEAAQAVKAAGYTGPVVGLVPFEFETVPGADVNIILDTGTDTLKKTLDDLLQRP